MSGNRRSVGLTLLLALGVVFAAGFLPSLRGSHASKQTVTGVFIRVNQVGYVVGQPAIATVLSRHSLRGSVGVVLPPARLPW